MLSMDIALMAAGCYRAEFLRPPEQELDVLLYAALARIGKRLLRSSWRLFTSAVWRVECLPHSSALRSDDILSICAYIEMRLSLQPEKRLKTKRFNDALLPLVA